MPVQCGSPRQTVGIDLAAQPERTAVCRVSWSTDPPQVEIVGQRWTDEALVGLIRGSQRVGIDCPLGWPVGFVRAISAHEHFDPWPGRGLDPSRHRRTLKYRLTDHITNERTGGRWPLSVSTDRIGVVALRCALLLDRLAEAGYPVDRTGAGVVVEVYPAATLRVWKLTREGSYKRPGAALGELCDRLLERLPLRFIGDAAQRCHSDHDAFDALVSALIVREVACGRTDGPSPSQAEAARVEGWIHLPDNPPRSSGGS